MNLIENKIKELESKRVNWNISQETIEFIINSLLFDKIKVLEIGTFNGYSALWFAKVADEVVSLEIDPERFSEAKENLQGVDNVELILGNALEEVDKLDKKFNVVLIDGMKSEYMKYLEKVLNVLEEDFRIFVDNTISHKEKIKDFFEYLENSNELEWQETGIGDGLIVIKRKS